MIYCTTVVPGFTFPGLDLHNTDPVHHITAGLNLDDLDRDLSDVRFWSCQPSILSTVNE